MSKLSEPLKALINGRFARPGVVAAPKTIRMLYETQAHEAESQSIGLPAWLTLATATTMTMNSPGSLTELFGVAKESKGAPSAVQVAELMREVGLKCISFNGIPRTINCLGAFRESLPEDVVQKLSRKATRVPDASNIDQIRQRGEALWKSIYDPFDEKLTAKLSESHPDLPVHILHSHYGALLSDPPNRTTGAKVGRVLTPLVAIACLRAQTGVGPQVTSHIFGLRKAFAEGAPELKDEDKVQGGEWLASEEGNFWILTAIDEIVEVIGGGKGSTYAPGFRIKKYNSLTDEKAKI